MTQLFVMRLANMKLVHPEQIEAKCSSCGHVVAVFPSGQEVMRTHKDVKLVCQVCGKPGPRAGLAPGAEFEPFQSVRKK